MTRYQIPLDSVTTGDSMASIAILRTGIVRSIRWHLSINGALAVDQSGHVFCELSRTQVGAALLAGPVNQIFGRASFYYATDHTGSHPQQTPCYIDQGAAARVNLGDTVYMNGSCLGSNASLALNGVIEMIVDDGTP